MRALKSSVALIGAVIGATVMAAELDTVEQELLAADSSFDRTVAERDLAAFTEMVAEDAVFFGGETLRGRAAVVRSWAPMFDPESGISLRWRPRTAEAASSGDLGYTLGTFRLTQPTDDGALETMVGSYVTIWRRGADGRWRAAVDIGTPPEQDASSTAAVVR